MILLLLALPLLWVGRVVFGGEVLLPVPLLRQIAPWGTPQPGGLWNPLMWDAMAFFYPIRTAAAQAIRHGHLPLWNPYILCGTPLLADVQSAVLYPFNVLFWLLPVEKAFGLSAYLHMALAGLFTAWWLRREGISRTGSLLGAVMFALGGWSIVWLELPNFLATAVWLPLLLGLLAGANRPRWPLTAAGIAGTVGMMLMAGHLQVALYCLLGAALYGFTRAVAERNAYRLAPLILGAVLGGLLAAPQLLPARALSEVSHRSTVATVEGYDAFVRMGLPPGPMATRLRWAMDATELTGLVAPDLYGNPSTNGYFGLGAYSEAAAYLGLLPFLLGLHGLVLWRRNRSVAALLVVGGVGILLALGTPLNALFYFGLPGFARFGTPSRALILVVMAWSGLVGFGWDRLWKLSPPTPSPVPGSPPSPPTPSPVPGEGSVKAGCTVSSQAFDTKVQSHSSDSPPGTGEEVGGEGTIPWSRTVIVGAVLLLLIVMAGILLFPAPPMQLLALTGLPVILRTALFFATAAAVPSLYARYPSAVAPAALALTVLDLWTFGVGYNLTGPASALQSPATFTQAVNGVIGEGRLAALNPSWPLDRPPSAVLPPNLATLGGWRDIGGYEGAYLRSYKEMLNAQAGRDTSPPANGNMVMLRQPNPLLTRDLAAAILTPQPLSPAQAGPFGLRFAASGEGWNLYAVTNSKPRAAWHSHFPSGDEIGLPLKVDDHANPNRVAIPLPGRDGYVLLNDAVADGWFAEVDGRPIQPMKPASAVGRWVKASAKERELVWEYRPPSLALGWKLAMMGLVATLLLGIAGGKKQRSD